MQGATDIHAHFLPLGWLGASADRFSLALERAPNGGWIVHTAEATHVLPDGLVDETLLLSDMHARGLDRRVVSPPPFLFLYGEEATTAVTTARALNEALLDLAARHPGVIEVAATLPMGHPEEAVRELERLAHRGIRMVEIGSRTPAFPLDDPTLEPLWSLASELRLPILVHPHYIDGHYASGPYHLRNLVGNPFETTYAAARLAASGVPDRHPDLSFILAHGGGALAFVLGRLQHGANVRDELDSERMTPLIHRFYYDSIVFSSDALAFLAQTVGEERILYGTDYPFDMADRLGPDDRLGVLGPAAAAHIAVEAPRALLDEPNRGNATSTGVIRRHAS